MFGPLPSDLWAIPMALGASALDIRFHKLRSLAGRQARDIRVCIENELVPYGNQNAAASAPGANDANSSNTQTAAGEDVSVSSVVGSIRYLHEDDHPDDEGDIATEGNIFILRSVRRQMAIFVFESQQSHDVNTLQWWKPGRPTRIFSKLSLTQLASIWVLRPRRNVSFHSLDLSATADMFVRHLII